jgi:CubicO group peptidase (beta-lactamase class C family)
MRALIVFVLSIVTATAALAADPTAQKVDQLFAPFGKPGSPGCSVGIMRNGSFVYKKSFGYASLELGVPLTSHSVFYVGSVSKQFTAASVVLAAEQGYLSLDDEVRKYVPELPDYGHPVTLRQMLHQTVPEPRWASHSSHPARCDASQPGSTTPRETILREMASPAELGSYAHSGARARS